jgi:hypothetical protein
VAEVKTGFSNPPGNPKEGTEYIGILFSYPSFENSKK